MEYADNDVSLMRRINLVFRFSYTIPFFMASVCGSMFAFLFYDPPVHIVILMPVVVLLLAVFVNFSNDYFDHRSGVDRMRFSEKEQMMKAVDTALLKKIYWEGNPFDDGHVSDKQGKIIMALLLIISVVLAVPIIIHGGWIVIVFGAVGIFLSYYYTAPPLNFGARGLGELDVAISFFMLVFCSFYVATVDFNISTFMFTGIFDLEIFVFAVIVGMLLGLMRLTDSMSGQEAHIANGEKSISVRFGLDGGVKIAKTLIIAAYVISALMVYFNPLFILLLLTLPFTVKAWKIMDEKGEHWCLRVAPLFFGTAFITEMIFVIIIVVISILGVGSLF